MIAWLADLAALAFIAVSALILHRDGLAGGPAFYELDTRLFYFPLAHWVGEQLHTGNFPVWLSGIFTGYPIFADGEMGLAYLPQVLLLWAAPTNVAMVWVRVLHVALAGVFTYALLRTLRLGVLPALAGGLVFAFGSFVSAQMHHENVVRSAVWLPAAVLCLERAGWRPGGSVFVWAGLGALAFAQAALGLHVQPVLMASMALALYAAVRLSIPRIVSCAAIIGGGLAVAALQWVPLGEWALVSSRRGGVDYEFASAFALPPANLLSFIFPYFFRLGDATTWWTLWQQWEIELYVGIPTLALVVVALVFARRIEVVYFAVLGLVSLWIAMAEYAPLFNLHQLLWVLPGFSFLRAPARFSYLVVFSCAGLAGFGLEMLGRKSRRLELLGSVPMVVLLAAVLVGFPLWRNWLLENPARAVDWAQSTYLAARAQYPIDPQLVVNGFVTSLDLANVKTAWSVVLLALTAACFLARGTLAQATLVGLIAVDLLVFAFDFHPRAPLNSLAPDLELPAGQRVFMRDPNDVPEFQPDQLLARDIPTTDGYSSLPSQRHVELAQSTSADPRLFDLWAASAILEPAHPADLHQVDEVTFRAQHALAIGFGGSLPQVLDIPPTAGATASLRLIGTLSYAFNVPQGQTVATLGVGSTVLPIRAGIELSERAYDRPSLAGLLQHQKAPVAYSFEEATAEGEDYTAHLYEANLALPAAVAAETVTFTPVDPSVQVEVYGLATLDASGKPTVLDVADRDGLSRLSETLIENAHALPRAYVLPTTQAFSPARHPALTPTQLVASPDMDVHSMVLIEGDSNTPQEPGGGQASVAAASVEDLGPNVVRVTATADAPSYLVLDDFYHRGWTARVDGQSARVFIANALFRAVAIGPGTHMVEFQFQPVSLSLGAGVSAVSLIVAIGAIVLGLRASPTRPHP